MTTPDGKWPDLDGARIDEVWLQPDGALVGLGLSFQGRHAMWVAGMGPVARGFGLSLRRPSFLVPKSHAMVAALRAHAVGRRVRGFHVEAHEAFVGIGDDALHARLAVTSGPEGHVQLFDAAGVVIQAWRPREGRTSRSDDWMPEDVSARGTRLLGLAERAAVERVLGEIRRTVDTAARRAERRAAAIRGDLARLADVGRLQKLGRLLVAQADRIPRGANRATLEDWEEGGTVEVPLDPSMPARAHAERFFHQARRLQRASAGMTARRDTAEADAARLAPLRDRVRAFEGDAAALDVLTAELRAAGVRLAFDVATAPRGKTKAPERLPYHTFEDARGEPILVGRGAADNDDLTLHHARPWDHWLHARGVPGAHVVVPLPRNAQCPPETLVDAATLAVHFSDARHEGTWEVTHADRRFVRKPRGAAPGSVVVEREHVLVLRMEPARLARLLGTRATG